MVAFAGTMVIVIFGAPHERTAVGVQIKYFYSFRTKIYAKKFNVLFYILATFFFSLEVEY